ncbi:7,8-didemethyl-8-hydroxy-5-deazariboflavin synthase CofG [Alteromonas lipotrueae]|uniref:7,8-didemethyl-8-hydroxy-5-deazariboflavin synthase CofG n=1 Tax=Alteromonas lipotrueae TaxID=2803814 RepID=UPI001C45BE43|nr:7,8-didemethyl-8-hydroxy-5-deazariboflavin synthase CofG [Alteromonas lipotrueae]
MLSRQHAIALEHATGAQLDALCEQAAGVRDTHWPNTLTYSRKIFIPLTNMCRDTCGYCTFVKHPDSGQANILNPSQVLASVLKGQAQGCKEALFSLGEKPEKRYRYAKDWLATLGHTSMVDYLTEVCEMVLDKSLMIPHVNAGTLTFNELKQLKNVSGSMGMMLECTSDRLMKKGQAHYACPDKIPGIRLKTLEDAGKLDIPFTTGILIGIGETWEERVDSLIAINTLFQKYGHIQEVIIQNFRAKAGTAMANAPEPTLDDMCRTLAMARLILDPAISLQAPPNLAQEYPHYIAAGINDWGGISPLTKDFINPERSWPQITELATACEQQGYALQERLTVYPKYLQAGERYVTKALHQAMPAWRSDGLAVEQCIDNTTFQGVAHG